MRKGDFLSLNCSIIKQKRKGDYKMKKLLIGLILVGIMGSGAYANYAGALASYNVSKDFTIKNVTIHTANTMTPCTFDAGSPADITMIATGASIKFAKTNSTTEASITIPQNASYWTHFPMPQDKNFTLYLKSATVPSTLEVLYLYR